MSCESQTGVWLMSFGAAQPKRLALVPKARAESPKDRKYSLADQVGPDAQRMPAGTSENMGPIIAGIAGGSLPEGER